MKKDLDGLELLQEELENLTGIKNSKQKTVKEMKTDKKSISPSPLKKIKEVVGHIIVVLGVIPFIINLFAGNFVECIVPFVVMCVGATLADDKKPDSKNHDTYECAMPESVNNLLEEVYKYNQLVKNIDVIDQLKEVGHNVSLSDRENVIKALTITREELVRALKTEKILRENPKFNPDEFAINLANLRTLQTSEQANDYGRLFNDTLQIAISVQGEMKKLQGKAK